MRFPGHIFSRKTALWSAVGYSHAIAKRVDNYYIGYYYALSCSDCFRKEIRPGFEPRKPQLLWTLSTSRAYSRSRAYGIPRCRVFRSIGRPDTVWSFTNYGHDLAYALWIRDAIPQVYGIQKNARQLCYNEAR